MNSLTIQHTKLLPDTVKIIEQLPVMVRKYALAKGSEIIANLTPLDRELFLLNFITELQLNVGHTNKSKDGISNEQIAIACSNFIFSTHKTLTKQELNLACLMHFIEKDTQQEGVNLKSVAGAIRGYLNNEERKRTMAEFSKMIDLVKKDKLDDTQKEQVIIDGCIHFWNEYKNAGLVQKFIIPVDKVCSIYYEMLFSKGLINFKSDQLKSFAKEARLIYESELEQAKLSRQINKSDYESLMELIDKNENTPLKNKRRKIALLNYFDNLITTNQSLTELLNEKTT